MGIVPVFPMSGDAFCGGAKAEMPTVLYPGTVDGDLLSNVAEVMLDVAVPRPQGPPETPVPVPTPVGLVACCLPSA